MGQYTDASGQKVLTVSGSGTPSSPMLYKYVNPQGTISTITVNYTNYNIKTNFGCSGVPEYTSTGQVPLPTSVVLPDQTQYSISYEDTPQATGYKTARIASVTLPAGGTIQYQYSFDCVASQTNLTRTLNPGGTWQYQSNSLGSNEFQTIISDPLSGSAFNHSFHFQGVYETFHSVRVQGPNGALLETDTTCYNGNLTSCDTTAITLPVTRKTVTRQFPSGRQSRMDTFFNTVGLATETDEYDWGSGSPGPLLRKTLISYAALGNHILDLPSSVTVQDGLGNPQSQLSYTYDEDSVVASGAPQLATISGSRGNATTIANATRAICTEQHSGGSDWKIGSDEHHRATRCNSF